MKKRILIWSTSVFCAFFVASCGPKSGEQQNGMGAAELNKIIDQMVKDEELEQSVADNIKNKLKAEEAVKINSMQLLQDIHSDRSLNMDKYLGKTLLIKDLLIHNISTVDQGGNYVKKVFAYPLDPKNNSIALSYNSDYGDYPVYTYKGSMLGIINDLGTEKPCFTFELNSPDQMKKINALEWESIEGNNFVYKVDILIKNFAKENIVYVVGGDPSNDMKANSIQINLTGAEIQK
ncbi:MAG: hypothetical protein RJA13_1969 [Bacteroidota bacterium]